MSKLLNFPMKKIKEGSVEIYVSTEKKISKKMPVFYNSIMKYNRDITINLLKQFPKMDLCDPLAGTGIRSIRFAKELKYKSITANDISKTAVALIKKNIRANKVKFEIKNEEANLMLLKSKGFDFIDLDVFGSPNFMFDCSIKKLRRNGILAVTATDTGALAAFPKACLRKYWAVPLKNELKHEIGLRILIRKIQLIGAQYDKALIPVFSYFKDHYYRVFLINTKGKTAVDEIIKQHNLFQNAGPMWLGKLWDNKLVDKMYSNNPDKFLKIIKEESKIDTVGFIDIHKLCQKHKLKIPKISKLLKYGSRTIFNEFGIKTKLKEEGLVKIIKKIS